MDTESVIVPMKHAESYTQIDDDEIELSRKQVMGKVFRKHILNKGTLVHPISKRKIPIDDAFVAKLRDNFHSGVCDIVQIPLANDSNAHTEDPWRNLGEVIDIQEEGNKIYAVLDIRDEAAIPKMGKTILGASAMMNLDYVDDSGVPKGPTLLHVLGTNRPYVTNLDNYEQIVKASADNSNSVVLLSSPDEEPESEKHSEENDMPKATLEELLAQLKTEHNIDVAALQATVSAKDKALEEATALSNTLTGQVEEATTKLTEQETALSKMGEELSAVGTVKLSNGETLTPQDIVGAVAELSHNHLALSGYVQELREKDAKTEVVALSNTGFILPEQVDGYVELKLSNPNLYDKMVPKTKIVELNKETGATPEDPNPAFNAEEYIAKLSADGGALNMYLNRSK